MTKQKRRVEGVWHCSVVIILQRVTEKTAKDGLSIELKETLEMLKRMNFVEGV